MATITMNFGLSLRRIHVENVISVSILVFALLFGQDVCGETGVVVVANKDSRIAQLTREEVSMLFLGKSKFNNEVLVEIIDSEDKKLRERFYLELVNMSSLRLKAYWSRIVFSGQGRPPQKVPIDEARALIEGNTETLTYLPANQVTQNMKIVFRLQDMPFPEQ